MSIKAISDVWAKSQHRGGTLLLLLAIADFCSNDDGTGAWPAVDTLAKKTRMSARHVQRMIERLEASAELVVERGAGPHGTNLYSVVLAGDILSEGVTSESQNVTRSIKNLRGGTDFDLEFGSLVKESLGDISRKTDWPQAEDRLRAILDMFCQVRGFAPNGKFERQQVMAGARDFVDSIGERPDLLREAMLDMHARQLLVSSPRSCISWCRNKLLKTDPEHRLKQLTADPGGFFDNGGDA